MPVDFNLLQPVRSPAPEMASIGNLLSAFAEQRTRQQQAQQAAEFQRQQFEAQQANIAADNARADQQLKLQQQEATQRQEAMQAKQAADERETAVKALPGIMSTAGDQPQAAAATAAGYGIGLKQQPRELVDEVGDILSDRVTPPKFDISIPHSPGVLSYDSGEQQRAQIAATDREKKRVAAAIEPLAGVIPYSGRVAPIAQAYAAIGAKPDDAIKAGIGSAQFAEGQQNSNARAAMTQRKITDNADRADQRLNQGAIAKLDAEVKDFERVHNIAKLNASRDSLNQALAEMKHDSKVGQFAAYESFLKGARGGAPTGYVMEEAQKHTGGLWDRFRNALSLAESGQFSPEVKRDIQKGVEASLAGLNGQLKAKEQAWERRFGHGMYDEVRGNVDAARGQVFNLDSDSGGASPAISPSGKRIPGRPSQAGHGALDALDSEADKLLGGGR